MFFLVKEKAVNEIQELCCSKFYSITVPEYTDRESHPLSILQILNIQDLLHRQYTITGSQNRVQLFSSELSFIQGERKLTQCIT